MINNDVNYSVKQRKKDASQAEKDSFDGLQICRFVETQTLLKFQFR